MNIVESIYHRLRRDGAVTAAHQFSTEFLNMSYNYYAARHRVPSADAMRSLYRALRRRGLNDLATRVAEELLADA